MTRLRVVLAGGGTAGHVTPALATAAELRRRGAQVTFVGTSRGLEATMVPAAGFELQPVAAAALRGRGAIARAGVPLTVGRAALGLAGHLRRDKVDVACVFGGYVSGPLAAAALLARVPLVIHEQNAVPGLANRIASRWARTVAASVPGTEQAFAHPERVVTTGNPVRAGLSADRSGLRDEALAAFGLEPDRRTLLAFGGSLGAERINDALLAARWQQPQHVQVLHVTGAGQHERVAAAWRQRAGDGPNVCCVAFVDRMELAYAVADLALCRAGASTLAELTVVGLPSILVPYPHAAADEQTANARALADAGAAVVLADDHLDGTSLVQAAEPLLADAPRLRAMADAARNLGRPQAAAAVADEVVRAAGIELNHEVEVET